MAFDIGTTFLDWKSFSTKLEEFSKETKTVWTVLNNRTVATANSRLKQGPPYKDDLVYAYARFGCKHYGAVRSGSTGVRGNQRTFKSSCPATLYVTAGADRVSLVIKELRNQHNHEINEELYYCYPEARQLPQEHKVQVEEMLNIGVSADNIRHHLQGKGIVVKNKDLHNLKAQNKKANSKGDKEDIIDTLNSLKSSDSNAVVHIKDDAADNKTLQVLFFQTSEMRQAANKYGDVLILDGTYSINDRRMPLYSIIGHGKDGKGVVMGHALMASETTDNIIFFLEKYRQMTSMEPTCVIIDKDFAEITSTRTVFPDAHIILCAFHTLKTFRKETASISDSSIKETVRDLLHKLVYCASPEEYEKTVEKLYASAPASFADYFKSNWDNCQEMWVMHKINKVQHLGNTTTNRIESFHQKLKKVLHKNMTVAECLRGLIRINQSMLTSRKQQQNLDQVTQQYTTTIYDQTELQYKSKVSNYAASLIIRSIRASQEATMKEQYETTENACKCPAFTTKNLPCKHVFRYRRNMNMPLFDIGLINKRWLEETEEKCYIPVTSSTTKSEPSSRKQSKVEKYKEALTVCKEIADTISHHSMEKYLAEVMLLRDLLEKLKQGKYVNLSSNETGSQDPVTQIEQAVDLKSDHFYPDQSEPIDLSQPKPIKLSPDRRSSTNKPCPQHCSPPTSPVLNIDDVPKSSNPELAECNLPQKPRVRGRPKGSNFNPCGAKRKRKTSNVDNKRTINTDRQLTLPSHCSNIDLDAIRMPRQKVAVGNTTLGKSDFTTLQGNNWLNDKIIHAYLNIIAMESPQRVLVLPCFLAQLWELRKYDKWIFGKTNISTFDKVLMPINDNEQHWLLLVVNIKDKTVSVLDSIDNSERSSKYINHWRKYTKVRNSLVWDRIPDVEEKRLQCGQQNDGYSCGVFLLMYADAILNGAEGILGHQNHVQAYRKYILARLITCAKPYKKDTICSLPACSKPFGRDINWIDCDKCHRWFHTQCLELDILPEKHICPLCLCLKVKSM